MTPLSVEEIPHVETLTATSAAKGCEGNVAKCTDSTERHQLTEEDEFRAVDDHEHKAQMTGRYEYMDIRRSDSIEGNDPPQERCQTSAKSSAKTEETGRAEESQRVEDEKKYHHKSKQATLHGSSMVMPRPDVLAAGGEEMEEYEEMARFAGVPGGQEQADYQNLPVKGRAVSEEVGSGRCAGIGGYIKVCAGMGEPGSNTSFDNPDYWHSRLFLKPDAVRT